MNDRIKLIIESRNLTASKFADEVGVQASSISHILSGRNKPSLEFIQKILNSYSDINYEWLISGKGTMHKEISHSPTVNETKDKAQGTVNDLFTSSIDTEKKEEETEDINEEEMQDNIAEKTENEGLNDNYSQNTSPIEKEVEEKTEKKEYTKTEALKIISNSKEVEKLIILYKDKSFDIYQN